MSYSFKDAFLGKQLIFFGGKGGVGKTSVASACAIHLSGFGRRCLLVSTDPAHSLSDIFDIDFSGGDSISVDGSLDCIELDMDMEMLKYINSVKDNIKALSPSKVIEDEVVKQIDLSVQSPGSAESAILLKVCEIINTYSSSYDNIIFDTAPTGHTLRLVTLPHIMGVWIKGMINKRQKSNKLRLMWNNVLSKETKEDKVISVLEERQKQFQKANAIITDIEKTSFVFVLTAERLPILETKKAISALELYDVPVRELVINKVLPSDLSDNFFMKRKEQELLYLEEIKQSFSDKALFYIGLQSEDIKGYKAIRGIVPVS